MVETTAVDEIKTDNKVCSAKLAIFILYPTSASRISFVVYYIKLLYIKLNLTKN